MSAVQFDHLILLILLSAVASTYELMCTLWASNSDNLEGACYINL